MSETIVRQTDIPGLSLLRRGKVRDIYDLGEQLLIVATDRISCFDVVLPTPIPDKGRVLTQLSCFWFEKTRSVIENHFVTSDMSDVVSKAPAAGSLRGRAMVVKKAGPLPVEAVVRGYLSGSAWKEYCYHEMACGIPLPGGLRESEKLPEAIFTPATKAEQGLHDENILFDRMADIVGEGRAKQIKQASLDLYAEAEAYAAQRGILIADTKFEFGTVIGVSIVLAALKRYFM